MSAKVLRTFALGGRWTAAAPSRLGVPVFGALRARAFGAGAPGSLASAEKERFVTAEMRGFAAAISPVRAGHGFIGEAEGS